MMKPSVSVLYNIRKNLSRALLCGLFFLATVTLGFAKDVDLNPALHIQLDSISVNPSANSNNLKFALEVKNVTQNAEFQKAMRKYLEYFFIGLALPDDKFWVNLNPKEPYKIVDSLLAETDIGRIMLFADLRLKKDTAELMDPKTSAVGKQYWERLYEKAEQLGAIDRISAMDRVWVGPGETVVNESPSQLSIVQSKLKVSLERIGSGLSQNMAQKQLNDYNAYLMQELIIPELSKKVNESQYYAQLREIFRVLILARWYKNNFSSQNGGELANIGYNVVKDTELTFAYQPEQVYRDYLDSFQRGEYTSVGKEGVYQEMTVMQYLLGGIDFKNIKLVIKDAVNNPDKLMDKIIYNIEINLPSLGQAHPLQYAMQTAQIGPSPIPGVHIPQLVESLPPTVSIEYENSFKGRDSNANRALLSKL